MVSEGDTGQGVPASPSSDFMDPLLILPGERKVLRKKPSLKRSSGAPVQQAGWELNNSTARREASQSSRTSRSSLPRTPSGETRAVIGRSFSTRDEKELQDTAPQGGRDLLHTPPMPLFGEMSGSETNRTPNSVFTSRHASALRNAIHASRGGSLPSPSSQRRTTRTLYKGARSSPIPYNALQHDSSNFRVDPHPPPPLLADAYEPPAKVSSGCGIALLGRSR
ncbi:hypothetical protein CYMTET_33526 [Cymbomonas tetramitiformis]|uniref:Uncharacterized protein n=1 Tax=Cymbomonas tetramitiformis TaxID=36881 RepID=A0AAE0FD29_9CHLO|nr:hypothetical protein CYMTET_33526 [Cymbomonas tetramitiformis]